MLVTIAWFTIWVAYTVNWVAVNWLTVGASVQLMLLLVRRRSCPGVPDPGLFVVRTLRKIGGAAINVTARSKASPQIIRVFIGNYSAIGSQPVLPEGVF